VTCCGSLERQRPLHPSHERRMQQRVDQHGELATTIRSSYVSEPPEIVLST
jgi:hypothetical protein